MAEDRRPIPMIKRASIAFAVVIASILVPRSAHAIPVPVGDPFTLQFNATTCLTCWPPQSLPTIDLNFQLTVVPVVGDFYDAFFQTIINDTPAWQVTGMSGFVNGLYPVALVPAQFGDGSWFLAGSPWYITFSADGFSSSARIINDHAFTLFQWNTGQVPITVSTVRVPDVANTFVLLALGMILCVAIRRPS